MTSNDNFVEKYNPPYTGNSRGVTSYLNKAMIVLSPKAVKKYKIDECTSADLFVDRTHNYPEVWIYLYSDEGTGKFKINFLGNSARLSVRGFSGYFNLDLPKENSEPFDLREIKFQPPVDGSYKLLPKVALAFSWPKIADPAPRIVKKVKKLLKKRPKTS